ncbi:MAG: hypothetical protein DMG06_15360 [Acidobacteria bacterium]|nr:MAG: hypothetical protein DMG06_15360 [Acidobacteriota bacterium]
MPEEKDSQRTADGKLGSTLRNAVERNVESLGLEKTDYVREALHWQYNWIGLAGAAAFALISGTGLPLVLAAGLELIYLSVVPQSSRFRRLVRSWKYAEEKRRHEVKLSVLFNELRPENRKRYIELEARCREIKRNYERLSSTSQMFLGQMEERLQGLLLAYLRLLSSAQQHGEYLAVTDPSKIQHDLHQLERNVQLEDKAPKVQEINRKRIEILTKRLEKFDKIRENRQVIDAQCKAIEDVLALIRDQSVTVQDPQEVSGQLDSLLQDVQQTEETVREVEAIFGLATPELAGLPPLPSGSAPNANPAGRPRLRT